MKNEKQSWKPKLLIEIDNIIERYLIVQGNESSKDQKSLFNKTIIFLIALYLSLSIGHLLLLMALTFFVKYNLLFFSLVATIHLYIYKSLWTFADNTLLGRILKDKEQRIEVYGEKVKGQWD